jgi:Uma2 family endonuclease
MSMVLEREAVAEQEGPAVKRWTLEEFIRMDSLGLFPEGEHYELIDGVIYKKMGQNNPHIWSSDLVVEALRTAFGPGFLVRQQLPLHIEGNSPEPDITVLRGTARDWSRRDPSPEDVLLLVEVSDSSLRFDRAVKAPFYARLGIQEYWILDVKGRTLEVYRDPLSEDGQWGTKLVLGADDSAALTAGVDQLVAIRDLLY